MTIEGLQDQLDLAVRALRLYDKTFDLLITRIEALELKTMGFVDPFCYECKKTLTLQTLPNFCNEDCKNKFDVKLAEFDKDDE